MKEDTMSFELKQLESSDKISQIVSILQNYIIDNNLESGTPIPPERELAEKIGVSRPSLREALRVAQAQGLIEITRGKRPQVAKPSSSAATEIMALTLRRSGNVFKDLVVVRQGLEIQIAQLAAKNATEEGIQKLEENIRVMEENIEDETIYVKQDLAFHNLLVKMSSNVVFEIIMSSVSELLFKGREASVRKVKTKQAVSGHKEILKAIKNRDPDEAAKAMEHHLKLAADEVAALEEDR